jgi:hypothetical protein
MSRVSTHALLAVLIAAFASIALFARAEAKRAFDRVATNEDRYYLPPATWLRAFSVGYNEAAADLVWITTIVYFGERAVFATKGAAHPADAEEPASAQYTVNYLAVVTSLDPRFRGAYQDGSRLTMYHKGRITRSTVDMAIELLERGIAEFPDDGAMTFSLGFLYYYELEPFLAAGSEQRKHAKAEGTELIARSASLPGTPPYVSLLSSTLLRREGLDDLVIEHLRAMLVQETDPEIRASLEAQLRQAIGKAAERDIGLTAKLERRWHDEMPFAPFDVFLILQPEIPWSARGVLEPWTLGATEAN